MIFPVFKIWLSPIIYALRSTIRSSQKLSGDEPSRELRTFGAGSSKGRRNGPATVYNITNATVTFTESEERMVELQDNKGWTDSSVATEPLSDGQARGKQDGIRQQVEVSVVSENPNRHNTKPRPPLW
jgi:hypothetical protein